MFVDIYPQVLSLSETIKTEMDLLGEAAKLILSSTDFLKKGPCSKVSGSEKTYLFVEFHHKMS